MRYQVLTENEGLDLYREFLDETCEPVEVAGYTFSPARVLEEMDPVAFQEGFNSYTEALVDSGTLVEGYTDGYQEDEDEDLGDTDDGYALSSAGFGTDEDYGPGLAEDY
jgi:hypothetical protein